MAAPSAPPILSPRTKTVNVNGEQVTVVHFGPFVTGETPPATSTEAALPTLDEETLESIVPPTTWADPAYFLANDGTQAQMPSSTTPFAQQTLAWVLTSATNDNDVIKTAKLRLYAYGDWPSSGAGVVGDATVRALVEFGRSATVTGKRIAILDAELAPYVGGATAQAVAIDLDLLTLFELTETFPRVKDRTVKWFRTQVLNGLRMQIQAYEGTRSYVTKFYAVADVELVSWDAVPDYQASYQIEVACRSDFAAASMVYDTGKKADGRGDREYHPISPGNVNKWSSSWPTDDPPTLARFIRATSWGVNDDSSGVGVVNEFTILSDQAEAVVRANARELVWKVEIDSLLLFEGVQWQIADEAALPAAAPVFRAPFRRGAYATPTFWISDFERDGVRLGATEIYSLAGFAAKITASESAFFLDETAELVYLFLADDLNPGASKGEAVGAVAVLPLATEAITAGPGGTVPFLPWIDAVPGVEDSVFDFEAGKRETPFGSIVFKNVRELGGPDFQQALYKLLQIQEPNPAHGFVLLNRPCRISASLKHWQPSIPTDVGQNEPLAFFEGVVTWDPEGLIDEEQARLDVHSWEFEAEQKLLAGETYTDKQFEFLHSVAEGQAQPTTYGASHLRLPAFLVDEGDWNAPARNPKLHVGENASAASSLYADDVAWVDTPWAYDAATQLITLTTTDQATIEAIREKVWTFDGDGEKLVPYDAGPATATTRSGALFRALLERLGYDSTRRIDEHFNALDDPAKPGGETHTIRVSYKDRRDVLDALRDLEETRGVYLQRLPNDLLSVVARYPVDLDGNATLLFDAEVQRAVFYGDVSQVARVNLLRRWNYPRPETPQGETSRYNYLTFPRTGIDSQRTLATFHTSDAGVEARLAEIESHVPKLLARVELGRKVLTCLPGSQVLMELADLPDPTGRSTWHLWIVVRRKVEPPEGEGSLVLRYVRKLSIFARPN